jgi:hypothetical protein
MVEGITCYERDEALCEDGMCLRCGCRLRNDRLSAQQREPVVRAALTRFESRVEKYIVQLKATGQADVAHLLRRDVDCLRAALNGGRADE